MEGRVKVLAATVKHVKGKEISKPTPAGMGLGKGEPWGGHICGGTATSGPGNMRHTRHGRRVFILKDKDTCAKLRRTQTLSRLFLFCLPFSCNEALQGPRLVSRRGRAGSGLSPQHFGRPRWRDLLRSGVRDQPGQSVETPICTKNIKISWVWLWVPLIPATGEAEAGESLEPGRRRL